MELLEMFSNQISVARIIYSIYYGPPQGAPHVNFDESFSNMLKDIKLIIDTGIASRELAECDSEDMAWLAVSALNTAMEEHLCNPENPRIDGDKLGRMIDLLFRGITL